MREALEQGGQHLYEETIKDIAQHPIDLDNDFKNLLDSIWNETKQEI